MQNNDISQQTIKTKEMANFVLDVGLYLMASGAHSGRVWRNCKRIANHWGFEMNINPSFTGILVSVWNKNDSDNVVTLYKSSLANTVHLEILTLISQLSWEIAEGKISFDHARLALDRIRRKPHYRYWIVALAVGVSCGCLCTVAGGNVTDAAIVFTAASFGSVVRYFFTIKRFNPFLSVIAAAFITTFIASFDTFFTLGAAPEMALATAVLYLIPGVPLINSVIDLLEGYFSASIARSLFAASMLTCIAVGMTLSILFLGINHF